MFKAPVLLLFTILGVINADISFTEVPSDVVVALGSQAEFHCTFTSSNAASLSWQKDGAFLVPSSKYLFTSNSLTVNQTEIGDDGTYTCVVTDQVLSITETRSAELDFAVIHDSFVINPDTKTVQEGSSTTLFCVHSGSLPIATITWTKDGNALSDSNSRLTISAGVLTHVDPPQTTSSLTIDPLVKSDSGMYACVATNSLLPNEAIHSSDSQVTVLVQLKAPTITMHPSSITVIGFDQNATILCSATGEPSPTITWKLDNSEIDTSPSRISVMTTADGNSTLSINNIQLSDVGDYHCTASNTQGTADSNTASLNVAYIEETFQLSPMDSIFLVSEDIMLDCTPPSSYPTPTISWLKDSVTVTGNKYTILSNGSLIVTGVELSDKGSYACEATNEYLNITRTSSPATVSIHQIPVITDSTEDLSVNEADSFLLTCNHTGVPSPVVTWYKDTVLLSSNNPAKLLIQSNELSVFSVTTNDEGMYECRVTNTAGSESVLISVDVIPVPNHVVVNVNLVVVVQSSVILPCHVEPDESIEFTWTKDGVSLSLPSPGYQLLSNGSIFIQAVAVSQEGVYVCTASNSAGSSEGTVDLTIQVLASAVAVQSSLTASQGQDVDISCTVSGDPAPLITWYNNDGTIVPNENTTNIQLEDGNATLSFKPVLNIHEGLYTCAVDNGVGKDNDTIDLTVNVAPSISASPVSLTLVAGDTAKFTCNAPGDPTPTVTWLTGNSVNVLLLGDPRIQVSDDNTLSVSNLTIYDGASFICRAVNVAGTASAIVTLHVQIAPSVSLPPTLNITQGATISLDCQAFGVPMPTVVWYKDDVFLLDSEDDRLTINEDSLTITDAYTTDSGVYSCTAVNIVSSATANVIVDVRILPLIIIPNPVLSVNDGDDAQFQCIAGGDPQPTLTWYLGNIPLPNSAFPRFSLGANNTLILAEVSHSSDEGLTVLCQAVNIAGTESAILTLDVNLPPTMTALNSSFVTTVELESLKFSCSSAGEPSPVITWYNNNATIATDTPGFQYVDNGRSLIVAGILKSHEGNFTCVGVNVAGTDSAFIEVYVQVPPSFSPYPDDTLAIENSAHIMICTAIGDPTPVVQWSRLGGVSFPIGSNLTLSPVSRADTGFYTCIASNAAGTASASVYLDVYYLPAIQVPPTNVQVPVSGTASFTCMVNGNPYPSIQWLFNGVSIPGAQNTVYTVSGVTVDNVGTYMCQVTNVVGTVTNSATLDIIVPPSAPNVSLVEPTSSSTLSVSWTTPLDDGGSLITSFTIEYRPVDSSDPFQTISVSSNTLSTELQGLVAFTFYDVRVRAGNVAGTGDPSEVFSPSIRTHPSSPGAPVNLAFSSITPSSIDVSWDEPTLVNGELGVYQMIVSSAGVTLHDEILFVDDFEIAGLSPSVVYKIQVRASSRGIKGNALWGPYSTINVLNGKEVIVSTSSSSVVTMATTTTPISSSISVPITSSTPVIVSTSSVTQTKNISIFTATPTNLVTLSVSMNNSVTLTPEPSVTTPTSTVLSVSMTTSNPSSSSASDSPTSSTSSSSSSILSVSPSPSVIPDPPTVSVNNLTLSVLLPRSIDVSWQPPTDELDIIDGYHILIDPMPDNIDLPIVVDGVDTQMYTITGLLGLEIYSVYIAPFNLGGDGVPIFSSITTTGEVPTPPTDIVVTVNVGLRQATFEWSPPSSYDGTLVNYHILIIDTNTLAAIPATFPVPVGQEDNDQSISLFLSGTTYTVALAAESTVGIGSYSDDVFFSLVESSSSSSSSVVPPPPSSSSSPPSSTSSSVIPSSSSSPVPPPPSPSSTSVSPSSSIVSTPPPLPSPSSSLSCPSVSPLSPTTCACPTTTVLITASPSSCVLPTSPPLSSSSSFSSSITIVPSPPVAVASSLTFFTPNAGTVVASWQLPSSGTYDGFHIYIDPVGDYTLPITVSMAKTFYQFNGLEDGVAYTITVATYNEGGDGPSIVGTVHTTGQIPGTPTNIQAVVDPETGNVLVTWSPPTLLGGTLIAYYIEATNTDSLVEVTAEVSVPIDHQSDDYNAVFEALGAGQYSITVQAENIIGLGPMSDTVSVSVPNIGDDSSSSVSTTLSTTSTIPSSSSMTTSSQLITTTTTTSIITTTLTTTLLIPSSSSTSINSTSTMMSLSSSSSSTSFMSSVMSSGASSLSLSVNSTNIGGTGGSDDTGSTLAIVLPIVLILVIIIVIVLGGICLVQYRLSTRNDKQGKFNVALSEIELSSTVVSEEQQQSASKNDINGVVQTKPPRYLTREETQNEDKEILVHNEAPLSTRDAYEEPPSDEEGNDSSLGRKGVHPSSSSTASREKKAMSTSSQDYEDVNLVRARKAKQREQKMKEQQKQQAKQQKQAKQKTGSRGTNQNRGQSTTVSQRVSAHEMY